MKWLDWVFGWEDYSIEAEKLIAETRAIREDNHRMIKNISEKLPPLLEDLEVARLRIAKLESLHPCYYDVEYRGCTYRYGIKMGRL